MADVFSKKKRSAVMAAVKGSGNRSTELRLIEFFRREGITGWRRKHRLHGSPDFVFPKRRVALFVDGCFWHGCRIHGTQPASNAGYWISKIARNRKRDRAVTQELRGRGWM